MNNFFNLFNPFFNNDFWNDSFDNLRNFNNLFHNSWHYNDFLNNFFDFDNFRYLNHLFNNFLDRNLNFFNSVHILHNLHNFLLNVFYWLRNIDVVINNFLNLDDLRFFHNNWIAKINLFDDSRLYFLNNGSFDELLNSNYSFVNDWDFNNSFYLFRYFSNNLNRHFDLFDNFFNSVLNNNFFNNSFDLNDFLHNSFNCHNFLNNLRHLNYSFNCLNDWNWLLDNSVDDFVSNLHMIVNLLSYNNFLLRNKDLN